MLGKEEREVAIAEVIAMLTEGESIEYDNLDLEEELNVPIKGEGGD